MKKEIGLLVLLFIISLQSLFAQPEFRFGPSFGLSITSKPAGQDLNPNLKFKQRVSPYVGCIGFLSFNKKFYISSGLLYERSGYCYKIEYGTGSYQPQPEGIEFQKLCFPLTAGISFKLWALSPSVYIGYRPNVLLSGRIEESPSSYNLFETGSTTQRYVSQFILGFSAEPVKNLEFNLSYFFGKPQEFTYDEWIEFAGHTRMISYRRYFSFNEVSFGLTYRFKLKNNKV